MGGCGPCPMPLATGLECTSSTPSTSSAAHVPTTSTMASRPPTSWKWTCSGGRRWRRPSASASASKVASARRRTRSGSRASSTSAAMCAGGAHDRRLLGVHDGPWSPPMPPRSTGSASSAQPPTGRRSQQLAHLVEVGAGVDERAEGHVAGDAGEAVEPGDVASRERRIAIGRAPCTGAARRRPRRSRCRCRRR